MVNRLRVLLPAGMLLALLRLVAVPAVRQMAEQVQVVALVLLADRRVPTWVPSCGLCRLGFRWCSAWCCPVPASCGFADVLLRKQAYPCRGRFRRTLQGCAMQLYCAIRYFHAFHLPLYDKVPWSPYGMLPLVSLLLHNEFRALLQAFQSTLLCSGTYRKFFCKDKENLRFAIYYLKKGEEG